MTIQSLTARLNRGDAGRVKTFLWWFITGSTTTLAVLMVQGGVQDLISGDKSAANFVLTIAGGGLLAGCIAIIMNRIK